MGKFKFWQKNPKPDSSSIKLLEETDNKAASKEQDYEDKYQAPKPNASGTGNLYEEVVIKPIRLEKE
ncbi:MAG: hypothetical protein EU531_09840 [Promethearchaeota archaeon]|nr:MAG: hypothetical protein EU531_09840 [Candidatus Lokiarchaeota archaeon]